MVADLPRILTDLDLLWVQEKCECRAGKPGILFRAGTPASPSMNCPRQIVIWSDRASNCGANLAKVFSSCKAAAFRQKLYPIVPLNHPVQR
jgi:hypothetical protein